MTHRLTIYTNYAKKYCNRTLIVTVIAENVVTCFSLGHSVDLFLLDVPQLLRPDSDPLTHLRTL